SIESGRARFWLLIGKSAPRRAERNVDGLEVLGGGHAAGHTEAAPASKSLLNIVFHPPGACLTAASATAQVCRAGSIQAPVRCAPIRASGSGRAPPRR